MTTPIHADIPDQLVQQPAILIRDGWATDLDEILTDALRRYLTSHSAELSEAFIRGDYGMGPAWRRIVPPSTWLSVMPDR
jgi:hypothetical protein